MKKWKECKVADAPFRIIDGDRGTNYPKQDEFNDNGYCLFLNAKNVTTNGFNFNECSFISKEKDLILRQGKLQKYDIILTTRGTVGNIGFFNDKIPYENMRINSGMVIIRSNQVDIIPEYTHQLFKYLKSDFDVFATGSAQPQLPIRDLNEITFLLPSLPEQKAIAGVLSSLDDKIDLLHRQNKTLEGMAEALWRKMFVEDADERWVEGKLCDIVSIKYGKDHKKLLDGEIPAYGSGGVMRYVNTPLYSKESVLIPRKGSLNNVVLIDVPFWTVDTMFYTEMKIINAAKYIYYFVKSQDLASMNVGSAVPSMTTDILNNMEILIPPDGSLKNFEAAVSPLFTKLKLNNNQIYSLEKHRNILLSKLMSGEVRVKI